jgi:hypothetical protein
MVRKSTLLVGAAGGLVAAVGAWNLYLRWTTEEVPYTTVATVGEVELRRYPATMTVETTAPTTNEAFGRLFRYISGENEGGEDLSMTAPVEADGEGESLSMTAPVEVGSGGESVSMTAPVAMLGDEPTEGEDGGVRMAFYLPAEYDASSAPVPTDPSVELVAVPERTLAVRRFSWRPTSSRIEREREALLATLSDADVDVVGEPFYMGYDAPWTLPFLRRNEVAVEVRSGV